MSRIITQVILIGRIACSQPHEPRFRHLPRHTIGSVLVATTETSKSICGKRAGHSFIGEYKTSCVSMKQRASTSTTNCQLYFISSVSRHGYQISPQFHPSLLILLICEKSQPKSHGISSTLITFRLCCKVYDTHLQKLYRLAVAIFLHPTRGWNMQY